MRGKSPRTPFRRDVCDTRNRCLPLLHDAVEGEGKKDEEEDDFEVEDGVEEEEEEQKVADDSEVDDFGSDDEDESMSAAPRRVNALLPLLDRRCVLPTSAPPPF